MSGGVADRLRIEDLLDSVADAVSALVMFASEAKNDRRLLTSLRTGVSAVTEAVTFLVGEATVTVKAWRDFGNNAIADEMQQCNDGLTSASNDVQDAVNVLSSNLDDADAKQTLLDAGKGIMKFMVRLLQLNDLYEVTVILKQIQLLRELLKERDSKSFAFDEFSLLLAMCAQLLDRRVVTVHDTKVKSMMDDAARELLKIAQPLRDTLEEFQHSFNPDSVKSRRDVLVSSLTLSLKKAHEAAKLSAKSPFDLSMLDKEFDDDFGDEEVVNVRSLDDSLDALAEAIRNGDENAVESILRRMKKDIESQLDAAEDAANNTDDPYLRAKLLAAIGNLRSRLGDMMDQLGATAKQALFKRDPEMLQAIISDLKKATAHILEGPAKDQMMQRSANIESLLQSLQRAVANKDGLEAVAIVRDVAAEILDAENLAKTLADNIGDDPHRADRLRNTASGLNAEKDELALATTAALRGLSPETLARLQASMQRVRDGMNNLVSASLMTSPQEMVDNAAQIEKALIDVEAASKTAKTRPDAVTATVSTVVAKVKPQLELALAYADRQDAETKRGVTEAADSLKAATANLVTVARGVVADAPKADQAALQKRLQEAIDRAKKANLGLIEAATDAADEEIRALVGKLHADVAKLRQAAATGDVETSAAGMAETKDNTKRLAILARISADGMEDMDLKNALLKLSGDLGAGLMDKLIPAMKAALANPQDQKKQAELNALFDRLLELASQVEKHAGEASPEDKMAQNAKRMNKVADRESSQVVAGNSADAAASLKELRNMLLRQRQLGNAVVERCAHDPTLADELMKSIGELEEMYKNVILATKNDGAKASSAQRTETPKAVEAFKKQSLKTGDLALGVRVARKEAERKAAEEAERKRQEALAAEADLTGKDEMYKAGHRVAQAVHKIELDEKDMTPSAMLARAAKKLADAMKQLSELSQSGSGSTSEIILMAREIANFVNDIVKWSGKCAEECSDSHLAGELRDSAAVAKNFAIQLKIICAVKAGTSADDPTTKRSLVICAQGLSKNVINTVHVSQVAKLKKKLKV